MEFNNQDLTFCNKARKLPLGQYLRRYTEGNADYLSSHWKRLELGQSKDLGAISDYCPMIFL
jgi:hypothetical protein